MNQQRLPGTARPAKKPVVSFRPPTVFPPLAEDSPEAGAGQKYQFLRYSRRAHARTYRRAEIVFCKEKAASCHKAVMYNQSAAGMYFEVNRPLTPNTLLRIKIRQNGREPEHHADEVYRARVVWCRKLSRQGDRRFGVGVAYLVSHH